MLQIAHAGALDAAASFGKKLLEAQRTATDIKPTEQHYDGYMYAPIHEVVRELKKCLTTAGLALQTGVESFEEFETKTGKGKPQWMTTVHLRFYLTDSETGYTREYPFLGRGLNEKDKGVTHAIQSGKKLFLSSLLLVEVTDAAPPASGGSGEEEGVPLIPEARSIQFERQSSGDVIRKDTGEVVRICQSDEFHGKGWPMIRVPENGARWLCIHGNCGYVEAHDRHEDEEGGGNPEASNGKPEAENGQPSGREQVNDEKRVRDLRAAVERLVRKNDIYHWQWRAIVRFLDYPDSLDAWGPKRWEAVHEGLRDSPSKFIRKALDHCAEDTPADPERCKYLRSLYDKADVGFAARAEAEAAIKSGWHDAVEGIIQDWEDGQVEAPELALTAGEGVDE